MEEAGPRCIMFLARLLCFCFFFSPARCHHQVLVLLATLPLRQHLLDLGNGSSTRQTLVCRQLPLRRPLSPFPLARARPLFGLDPPSPLVEVLLQNDPNNSIMQSRALRQPCCHLP